MCGPGPALRYALGESKKGLPFLQHLKSGKVLSLQQTHFPDEGSTQLRLSQGKKRNSSSLDKTQPQGLCHTVRHQLESIYQLTAYYVLGTVQVCSITELWTSSLTFQFENENTEAQGGKGICPEALN